MSKELSGIYAAVTTPFTADGSLDEVVLRAQADRLAASGIHGIVPTGTSGEFTSLSDDEYRRTIDLWIDFIDGRIDVVPGIGALTTAKAVELAKFAESKGADGVMVVAPFYDPLTFDALKSFYTAISDAVDLPIMYYNLPDVTGQHLSAAEIAELGSIENVKYLKSTSDDAVALTELLTARQDAITAFNGYDTLTFLGLSIGAKGSVWGVAGVVPEQAAEFWQVLAEEKDLAKARHLWKKLWKLSSVLESVNYVAGLKAALELTGNPAGEPRDPILPLPSHEREKLAAALDELGVLAK